MQQAVRKLTYLQMMGYDMSWASFAVVEVMSSPRFAHKRIGCLAACQTFTAATDVVLLTTNLLKKEFQSPNQYEVGLAINCLANIVTRDLARDLIGDVVSLIAHSKPYVRKKAVLSLYKLYLRYPQALRLTFERLKDKLDDAESAVVSCAVNVICELANKNPTNYLALAPKFFRLLTTSSNNWMLIKVVKLLGSLVSEEPRLARKLLEPLATIIQNTAAKSLLYECIHTVTLALPYARKPGESAEGGRNLQAVVALCADHLRQFVEDPDQNLKYLGLVGFVNLMKSFPRAVVEHKELVLLCLSDDDVTIRMRALELLTGMVTRRNLTELVHKLMQHVLLAEGPYRDEIVRKILFMCSRDRYAYLSDVSWYLSVLVDLAYVQGPVHGPLVAAQLIDVSVRAEVVRGYAVRCMLGLLRDSSDLFLGQSQATMAHVLYAAGWIIGEYADQLPGQGREEGGEEEEEEGEGEGKQAAGPGLMETSAQPSAAPVFAQVLAAYLDPRVTNLPEDVQVVYMQSALKVVAAAPRHVPDDAGLEGLLLILRARLSVFLQSIHIEVQERAATMRNLLASLGIWPKPAERREGEGEGGGEGQEGKQERGQKVVAEDLLQMDMGQAGGDGPVSGDSPSNGGSGVAQGVRAMRLNRGMLEALFREQLQPVNPKAQRKVPMPPGLDLSAPIKPAALAELEEFQGGFPRDPDLAKVTFTNIFVAAETVDEGPGQGFEDLEAAFGTPRRPGGGEGYEEAVSPSYQPGNVSRQPWRSTPFYLAASSGQAREEEAEGEEVVRPSFHLTAVDVDGRGRRRGERKGKGGGKGKKGGHRRGRVSDSSGSLSGGVAVLREEVMPEGAVESDSDGAGTRRGRGGGAGARAGEVEEEKMDLKDVDITRPLGPHEAMPRMEHRVAPVAEAGGGKGGGGPATRGEGRKKQKKKKEGKSEEKRGERASSSRRRRRKGPEAGRPDAQEEDSALPLIELGDTDAGAPPSLVSSSLLEAGTDSETRRLKSDVLDLLRFDLAPAQPGAARLPPDESFMALASSGPEADRNGAGRVSVEESTHRAEPGEGGKQAASAAPGEGRRRMRKARERATVPVPDMDSNQGKGGSGSAESGGGAPGSYGGLRLPLLRTKGLRVEYSLTPDPSHQLVTLHFRFKAPAPPSSSAPLAVHDLQLTLTDLPEGVTSLLPSSGATVGVVVGALAGGGAAKASLKLRLSCALPTFTRPIPVKVSYKAATESEGDLFVPASPTRTVTQAGTLLLAAGAFLRPGRVSPSEFMSLLSRGDVHWQEANVRLPLSKRKKRDEKGHAFELAVQHLSTFFQAQVVESTPPAAAAMYAVAGGPGRPEHHVALLAKFAGGGREVEVAIKSDLPELAASLAREGEALCIL
jgi:AP-3 complex subunit delta-1